ncbi:hypothetical protein P170DRAFT_476413 [Aspergillus steynii IBT 23096]|uniref:Uncharacterized protein n=1 Tax=Aspergillus steynii IBT 23096 TaxID=1392250 RepID=A0A2I2G4D5_9EURO|nr:uncharacterized protein P170DRAFT_476413 [Aspergillus steynii IBT 23096]PLB47736.1 hypothetical protein P170DRAFT_476413 [Aspergillus steynii IBT 23096]
MPLTEPKDIGYTNPQRRSPSVDRAVTVYSEKDTREINGATVKCTPEHDGQKTWHTGGTNPDSPLHVTVVYLYNGYVVTTKHIDREGKAV